MTSKGFDEKSLLIGAHTSTAGGIENALYEGVSIGATTVQLFTANQRQWVAKPLTQEIIDRFDRALEETGLQKIMSHDSYLINLGAPDEEVLQKSRRAFSEEIQRCLALGISFLNFHPGAALKGGIEKCLDTIVESLLLTQEIFQSTKMKRPLELLIEMTAGQGSTVGKSLEEISYMIEKLKKFLPIGVCVDTCHVFAAGYDISTEQGLGSFLDQFDEKIGLEFLKAFHVNDSKKECGTRVDRHASLGEGCMGLHAFSALMKEKRVLHIPKYLETPEGPEVWKKEIAWLRSQAVG